MIHARRAGWTILEVMLALAIFAAGTVFIIELLQRAQTGQADAENVLIAASLGAHCLEQLRSVTFANLGTATCAAPSGFSRFTPAVSVTSVNANLSQVQVSVSWAALGGETTSVALQTYRSAN